MAKPSRTGIDRRSFLTATGAGALVAALPGCQQPPVQAAASSEVPTDTDIDLGMASWEEIRALFPLTSEYVYMVNLLLTSHPKPLQDEIDRISNGLNQNPALYLLEHYRTANDTLRNACAGFLGAQAEDIALTDSTTMGLGILYGGLQLTDNDDILSTTHDHNATYTALHLASLRTGASYRRIPLYDYGRDANTSEIVQRMLAALQPNTRLVATTWVHSATGVKLPIRAMADALAKANQSRKRPVRLFVDGVHGFGVENFRLADLGCDAFVAGCHKWLWGPRGTGLAWANSDTWEMVQPTMTAFEQGVQDAFLYGHESADVPMAWRVTPGGFHSFENRWALPKAFEFQQAIGRQRIQDRIHGFTHHMVKELDAMPHVKNHTPMDEDLQSGLVCFEVEGYSNTKTIQHLLKQGVIGSNTPYNPTLARFSPAVTNSQQDVQSAVEKVAAMLGTKAPS